MRSSDKGRPGMIPSLANLFCYLDCVWTLRYFEKYKNKNAVRHHGIITTLPHFFEICLLSKEILFLYDVLTCPFIGTCSCCVKSVSSAYGAFIISTNELMKKPWFFISDVELTAWICS